MLNLVWFRSDLRIYDNPALTSAIQQGSTCAVYVVTPQQWRQHDMSPARLSLLIRQVKSLANQLQGINVPLVILSGTTFDALPSQLLTFAQQHHVTGLYFNAEYEFNERTCAYQVANQFRSQGIKVQRTHDQCLVEPGKLCTQKGEPYKVFSAFKKALLSGYPQNARTLLGCPEKQAPLSLTSNIAVLSDIQIDDAWSERWPEGEDYAHMRLQQFTDDTVHTYDRCRDVPSLASTSQLSPYLAIGALSVTQCMQAMHSVAPDGLSSANEGVKMWVNELLWREFYRHLLYHFPDLSRHKPFKPETDRLPWRHDLALFERWCRGETGYPLVDAAMQQLVQTGWMHNRLRMVTAMFLTKHLFIDWRWGERFFMQHLVDGDLASNNGGWQWSASTGVDAVPYFRVFNPVRQSERFDPEGVFIRRYLPVLSSLDNRSIHLPSVEQANALSYPLPIVEHRSAVDYAVSRFKALGKQAS